MKHPLGLAVINLAAAALLATTGQAGQIHDAARAGDLAKLKALVKADRRAVNARHEDDGKTPLIVAVESDNIAAAEFLLGAGADVNRQEKSYHHPTALHAAAREGSVKLTRLLLARGATVDVPVRHKRTALHYAAAGGYLQVAAVLLAHKADVNAPGRYNNSPLLEAARNGHLGLVKLLLAKRAKLETPGEFGRTALFRAVEGGYPQVARALIAAGANVNAASKPDGRTPLHAAMDIGLAGPAPPGRPASAPARPKDVGAEMVKLLLKAGARAAAAETTTGRTPLHEAARDGKTGIVKLLLAGKADVNARDRDGNTALYLAAMFRREEITRGLLGAGADVNLQNNLGRTPLLWAPDRPTARLLLAGGARVDVRDSHGNTPLHWAVKYSSAEVVALLLANKADSAVRNKAGRTPLELARKYGKDRTARLLSGP